MSKKPTPDSKVDRQRLRLLLGLAAAAGSGGCGVVTNPKTGRDEQLLDIGLPGRRTPPPITPTTPGRDPAGSGTGGGGGGGY